MKEIKLGNTDLRVPAIVIGCMRFADSTAKDMNTFIHTAMDKGANFFDHADIYGLGKSEELFGAVMAADPSLHREDMIIQSKCGINSWAQYPHYNSSKEYILKAVDSSLSRLGTDYLDVLLIHRPDALVEPEEVAEAFDKLYTSGKVRRFGVSNHKSSQIELLKKYVKQDIIVNQLEFSIVASTMVSSGMEVNMPTEGAANRDDSVLDYCRLKDITIQAWSPFQISLYDGTFIGSDAYPELNAVLNELAAAHNTTPTTISAAWILRHPAKMQLISGTTSLDRFDQIVSACDIELTREEWYRIYRAAGRLIP